MSVLARLIETAKKAQKLGWLEIPGNPAPASRPRVTRWGVYYGKSYTAWRKLAEKVTSPGELHLPPNVPLLVVVETISARPRTSKKLWPKGDTDNFAKGPLDVITKATGWWHDDDQIVFLLTAKRWAEPDESARTIVEIYRA
jgi:Holliday junction resolvase RusA-like endonuclease